MKRKTFFKMVIGALISYLSMRGLIFIVDTWDQYLMENAAVYEMSCSFIDETGYNTVKIEVVHVLTRGYWIRESGEFLGFGWESESNCQVSEFIENVDWSEHVR